MTESEISALKEKARLADIEIGVVDELGITHYSEEDMKLGGAGFWGGVWSPSEKINQRIEQMEVHR